MKKVDLRVLKCAILLLVWVMAPLSAISQNYTSNNELAATSNNERQLFLNQRVTLEFHEVSLLEALNQIAVEAGMNLNYNPENVSLDKTVSAVLINETVEEALSELLNDAQLNYLVSASGQLVLLPLRGSRGQPHVVSGRVVESGTNDPLPGANVILKGTTIGSATDNEGHFEFTIPQAGLDNAVLAVSYLGFVTKEIPVDGRTQFDVVLEPVELDVLGELIVIGYGVERRGRITGSVGSVGRETIEAATGVVSPEQTMQGRVSGVNISSSSGIPGQGFRVDIRGAGSISAGNEPLYVVDGTPIAGGGSGRFNFGITRESPISHINPDDIESISILKDAAATAIYGSRASNGVVLITTRQGSAGPTQINFSTKTGFETIPNPVKMANSDTWFEVMNEARMNYNNDQGYTENDLRFMRPLDDPRGPDFEDTDWLDLVTRDRALIQNYSLSAAGGTPDTRFFVSGSHMTHEGIILTNNFERTSGRLNIDHAATDRINLNANVNLSRSINNRIQNEGSGRGILVRSIEQPPHAKPYHEDGSYQIGGVDIPRHNGLQVINEQTAEINRYLGLFDASGVVRVADWLRFQTKVGGEFNFSHEYVHLNENHPRGVGNGVVFDWRQINRNLLFENTLMFDYMLTRDLNLSGLVGQSVQRHEMELNYVQGQGYPTPSFGYIGSAGEITAGHSGWTGFTLDSYLSRVNLNYQDRYTFSGTIRRDGSSKFVGDNRYGIFPSASVGWRISKEPFFRTMPRSHYISDLRIRLAYGLTGNQEGISNFIAIPSATGGHNYRGNSGIAVTAEGNPDLTWETGEQFNLGLDLALFNSRISLTSNYFVQNTNDLLYNRPVQGTTGFTTSIANVGNIRNRGMEFEIHTVNMSGGSVLWNSNFNIAFNRNEILSLIGDEPIVSGVHVLMEGEPMGTFYMLRQTGIYQHDDEVPGPLFEQGVRAGDVIYEDINGDGLITSADRQVVGHANPKFFGGFSNSLSYRNFDLNILVSFKYGNKIYNQGARGIDHFGANNFGMRAENIDNRWTGPNTSNSVPRASTSNYNLQHSTRFLEDGSYLRVQNVTLGYSLPNELIERYGLRQVRVHVAGKNLLTITGYSGMDPDVSTSLSPVNMGIDYYNVPQMRMIEMGINVGL